MKIPEGDKLLMLEITTCSIHFVVNIPYVVFFGITDFLNILLPNGVSRENGACETRAG
jgi:hypothetical protein